MEIIQKFPEMGLRIKNLEEIQSLCMEEEALKERNIAFSFDSKVSKYIADKCDGTKTGARELRNIIRREIETPVVDMIISDNAARKISASILNSELLLNIGK